MTALPDGTGRLPIKIKSRLLISYGAVLVIAAAGLLLGLVSVVGLSRFNQAAVNDSVRSLAAISQMRAALGWQQAAVVYRSDRDEGGGGRQFRAADKEFRSGMETAWRHFAARERRAAELLDAIRADYARVEQVLAAGGRGTDAELAALFEQLAQQVQTLYSLNLQKVDATNSATQARSIAILLALLVTATLVVGWMVSLRLARIISEPLEAMSRAASQIAIGDFNVRLPHAGIAEVDNASAQFNRMADALRHFHALNIDTIIAEQRRNEAILNSIDDGLIICDHNGRVDRINPVALLQLGKREPECVGHSIAELLPVPGLERSIARMIRHDEEPEIQTLELRLGEEGPRRVLGFSVVPFQDVPESGAVVVLRDITAQREFDNLRTEFVLRASHELRTPLTSIRMALGLIEDRLALGPDSRERELLDTVNDEMQRMVRLLNDLLDLSRMYARSLRFEVDAVSVQDLIARAVQRFNQSAAEAGVVLKHSCEEEDLSVSGDRVHLDRVMDNLLSNALRHTPAGGDILLSCWQSGAMVYLSISDSGEGIPLRQQARVFEPFVQVGIHGGGAGLGLAMCREIVQQHGGSITLRSVPGRGSVFTIKLPA